MMTTAQLFLPLLFGVINSNPEVSKNLDPSLLFEEKLVEYRDSNDIVLQGFLVYPKIAVELSKGVPAVIVFHTFAGRTDFEELKARDLALLGYVAFAADVYGKGVAGNYTNENIGHMLKLLNERTSTLQSRILAAWNTVKKLSFVDDQKIACIGFSIGGLSCLDLARFNVGLSAAVSFHGLLDSYPESNGTTSTSIQVHNGIDDPNADLINSYYFQEEMKAKEADFQLTFYSDTLDGFTIPDVQKWGLKGVAYNEKSDRRSNAAMQSFLEEKLLS